MQWRKLYVAKTVPGFARLHPSAFAAHKTRVELSD